MIDFEQTYLHRKAVYRAIQQSQKVESEIAERIGKIAVRGKQELLLLLSAWLLELTSMAFVTEEEKAELQGMTQVSLEQWVQLQSVAKQIENDLKGAETAEKAAIGAFQKEAPFGSANKLFAAGERKVKIQGLQDDAAMKQKHRESLVIALRQNTAKRQDIGEQFFRGCLTQLDKLSSSRTFGKEATTILNRMTTEISKTWAGHQKQQTEEFVQMAGLVETLRVSYKDMPAALPQQGMTLPPPEQAKEEPQKDIKG